MTQQETVLSLQHHPPSKGSAGDRRQGGYHRPGSGNADGGWHWCTGTVCDISAIVTELFRVSEDFVSRNETVASRIVVFLPAEHVDGLNIVVTNCTEAETVTRQTFHKSEPFVIVRMVDFQVVDSQSLFTWFRGVQFADTNNRAFSTHGKNVVAQHHKGFITPSLIEVSNPSPRVCFEVVLFHVDQGCTERISFSKASRNKRTAGGTWQCDGGMVTTGKKKWCFVGDCNGSGTEFFNCKNIGFESVTGIVPPSKVGYFSIGKGNIVGGLISLRKIVSRPCVRRNIIDLRCESEC